LTIKKRPEGAGTQAKTKRTARPAPRPGGAEAGPKRGARPRIHASHATPRQEGGPKRVARPRAAPRARAEALDRGEAELIPALKPASPGGVPRPRRPLGAPKRAGKPRAAAEPSALPEPSSAARELALALASAALDKKAVGVEILDVTGKVDYADFLVVMTGRSDRHVHAIATGIEEGMRRRRLSPLSMEGLTSATWVLIDFGDVVVHVFQEEARALYDIEGLWIDAGRIPVPEADPAAGPRPGAALQGPSD
jgi:ribosome-associated protein